MTAYQLQGWIRDSKRGDRVPYHTGEMLAIARKEPGLAGRRINAVADYAYLHSGQEFPSTNSDGHMRNWITGPRDVRLIQQRDGEGCWLYLAERL